MGMTIDHDDFDAGWTSMQPNIDFFERYACQNLRPVISNGISEDNDIQDCISFFVDEE